MRILFTLILLFQFGERLRAQDSTFTTLNPFHFELVCNYQDLLDDTTDNYHSAQIRYSIGGEKEVHLIKVKPRGNNRRKKCDYPPLKLKFDSNVDYHLPLLKQSSSLKMVNMCLSSNSDSAQQALVREYMVYQMYASLTNYSFKTYWCHVTIVDQKSGEMAMEGYAFFIESFKNLQERVGMDKYKSKDHGLRHFSEYETKVMSVFQFMINNYDWNTGNYHNMKAVKAYEKKPILIPYDFDFCRFVNASYAYGPDNFGVDSLDQRKYLGLNYSIKELNPVFQVFQNKKKEFYSLIEKNPLLSDASKTDCMMVLDSFYRILESKTMIKQSFGKDMIMEIR